MKSNLRLLMAIAIVGILCGTLFPSVNAEVYKLGTKKTESDLDSDENRMYYFDSQSILHTNPDYIDYVPLIFDGDESTGINYNFGAGHSTMIVELMFPNPILVSNIILKPEFGGNASTYSFYIYIGNNFRYKFADDLTVQKTIDINGGINGIRLELKNRRTDHFYFNDVIINYTPDKSAEGLEDDDDFDIVELFIEPPFLGLLWIITLIALIMSLRRGKRNKIEKIDEKSQPEEDEPQAEEPEESQPPEKEERIRGRFCPSCGKFTQETGSFCPHCKRSME